MKKTATSKVSVLYGNVDFLADELKELEERGDPSSLDMRVELVLMRSFASKLLKSLAADFCSETYRDYLEDRKRCTSEDSMKKWSALVEAGVLTDISDFIAYNYSNSKTTHQLMKALVEIKNFIKIINDSKDRQSKKIDEGAFGQFCVGMQKKVEEIIKGLGGRESIIIKFRKWFGKYIKRFKSMNLK